EHMVKLEPGEVLEVFQLRDGKSVSVARVPETARSMPELTGSDARAVVEGAAIEVLASAPIQKQQADLGGSLVLAQPVDLSAIKRSFASHALAATLVGLDKPFV